MLLAATIQPGHAHPTCAPWPRPPQAEYLRRTMEVNLTLTAEDASKDLHKFRGRAQIRDARLADLPLSSAQSASAQSTSEGEVSSAPSAPPAGARMAGQACGL